MTDDLDGGGITLTAVLLGLLVWLILAALTWWWLG